MKELFRLPSRESSEDEVDTLVVTFVVRLCVVVFTLSTLILLPVYLVVFVSVK